MQGGSLVIQEDLFPFILFYRVDSVAFNASVNPDQTRGIVKLNVLP